MKSRELEEFRELANKLNILFFACDSSFRNWQYPSRALLSLLNLREEDFRKNPEIWLSRILKKDRAPVLRELEQLSGRSEPLEVDFPFHSSEENPADLRIQFRPLEGQREAGAEIYLCSAENLTREARYRRDALKTRDYEIEISARIQKALLTGLYSRKNDFLEIAAETLPSARVDGDFYEFIPLSEDSLDFIIGDVMGKGIPAALLAAAVKSVFFRTLIMESVTRKILPGTDFLIREMDRKLTPELMAIDNFLTLYYCRILKDPCRLEFVDAGHTSAIYFCREDQRCWTLKGANMPIGFSSAQEFTRFCLPLCTGDLLFFYSDGITEIRNSEDVQFGEERLSQLISAHRSLSPEELIKKVLTLTFFYTAGGFQDDVTAVAIRMLGEEPDNLCRQVLTFQDTREVSPGTVRDLLGADLRNHCPWMDEPGCLRILLAYSEALSNCMVHATGSLEISWKISRQNCIFDFTFAAPDFNWYTIRSPRIEDYNTGGFGMYLIAEIMDSQLLLHGGENRKKLILVKEAS